LPLSNLQTVEPDLATILAPKLARRQELKAQITLMEAECDGINDEIKTTLVTNDTLSVLVEGYNVTLTLDAKKDSLDKHKLLEEGVTMAQLKAATKTSTFTKLDIRKAAAK
jgi:hypothetical protein